jgi:hypothetical protein
MYSLVYVCIGKKILTPLRNSVISISGFLCVTAPRNWTMLGWRSFTSKFTSCLKSWLYKSFDKKKELTCNNGRKKVNMHWK